MRFAWLFLGYLLMLSFPIGEISLLPVLGYALMLFAVIRLSKFESVFGKAKLALYAALLIGVILLGLQIYLTAVGNDNTFNGFSTLYACVQWADELVEMLVMFFVYLGVRTIGEKAEYPALEKQAPRNMAVMLVYLAVEVVITVLRYAVPSLFTNFELIYIYPFIIGLIWRALNLWMFFKCYVGIATVDEEYGDSKPKKKSKRQIRKENEERELRELRNELKRKNNSGNGSRGDYKNDKK